MATVLFVIIWGEKFNYQAEFYLLNWKFYWNIGPWRVHQRCWPIPLLRGRAAREGTTAGEWNRIVTSKVNTVPPVRFSAMNCNGFVSKGTTFQMAGPCWALKLYFKSFNFRNQGEETIGQRFPRAAAASAIAYGYGHLLPQAGGSD
jgi:hypothetical protein